MKTLAALLAACALAMATGCAASKPVAMAPVAAAEPDPWDGYKDGRVDSTPKESKETPAAADTAASKPTSTGSAGSTASTASTGSAGSTASTDENPLAEDTAPVPAKKAGKKKKARSGAVAGKKPRKRSKRPS